MTDAHKNVAMINDDPFAPVQLRNIENAGRKTDKFWVEIEDSETNEFREIPGVGVVHGSDYQLVSNRQVHDMAVGVLDETGMVYKPLPTFGAGHSEPLNWNGRRFSAKWFVEDAAVDVPGGSKMMLGVEARNSYDGSCKVGLAFFAMHLVCSNQFYSNNLLGTPFVFPHVNKGGNLEEDIGLAMAQIRAQAAGFVKVGPNMRMLQDTRVDKFTDFLALREQLKATAGLEFRDKVILDELSGRGPSAAMEIPTADYSDPSTYWSIGNAYTAVCTHQVGGVRGADQSGRVIDFLLNSASKVA